MRITAPVIIALAAVTLSGCVTIVAPASTQAPPTPTPTVSATPDDGVLVECEGELVIDQPGEYAVGGDCEALSVQGQGIEVRIGDVGTVTINGDDNEIEASAVDLVQISGQSNEITATDVGTLDIRGDRNEAEFSADLGSLVIAGNDNEVGANAIGQTSDSGDRNRVTGR